MQPCLANVLSGFQLAWPALANFGVYRNDTALRYFWVDDTKAPIART